MYHKGSKKVRENLVAPKKISKFDRYFDFF